MVGQAGKIFSRDRVFLRHDKVIQGKEELCRDKAFFMS